MTSEFATEQRDPGISPIADGLAKMAEYPRAVLSWVAQDGYPINVDVEIEVKSAEGTVRFSEPAGFRVPPGTLVAITGSRFRSLQDGGFDRRRHVTLWGPALARPRGRFAVSPTRVWAFDELDMPIQSAYERSLPKARGYFEALSVERGEVVRPAPPRGFQFLRAPHIQIVSAAFTPVLLGIAVAARTGLFDVVAAAIAVAAACAVSLGMNAATEVLGAGRIDHDVSGAANASDGALSVLRRARTAARGLSVPALGCYGAAAILGAFLLVVRGSPVLDMIYAIGLLVGVACVAPPVRLLRRGFGELSAALSLGPVILLGVYAAQSGGRLSIEAVLVSVPVGLLAAQMILVNQIPNREADARAKKPTLPVRLSKAAVVRSFDVAVAGAIAITATGVLLGSLPIPLLLSLLAIALAVQVHRGLGRFYDNPYGLMDTLAASTRLYMSAGLLLLAGYLLTIADQTFLGRRPFLW